MSRNDAKQLTEQFQAVLLKLQTAVAEIEEQINIALAARDGIEPPTGKALRDVLAGMHKIPDDGIEAQVLRW